MCVPIATGILQAISLTLIFNSSSIRFLTLLMLPSSMALICLAGTEQTGVIVAGCLLFVGIILYNLTANCGQEAIDEYRTEMRARMDAQEAVFFKVAVSTDYEMQQNQVAQNGMYVQQQPMY